MAKAMANELTIDWQEPQVSDCGPHLLQAFEDASYTPVRDLRTRRNARSITGQLDSIYVQVCHVFESLGEMRHATICDADWNVVKFQTQPERINLADGRTYTPDAKVWIRGSARPIFREVKPDKWLRKDPELDGKLLLIADACARLGCDFEIISDSWYNCEPRLQNAQWIRRAARHAPTQHLEHVARLLHAVHILPADEVARQSGLGADGVFAAYALAGLRFCHIDLNQPACGDTLFSMVSG